MIVPLGWWELAGDDRGAAAVSVREMLLGQTKHHTATVTAARSTSPSSPSPKNVLANWGQSLYPEALKRPERGGNIVPNPTAPGLTRYVRQSASNR